MKEFKVLIVDDSPFMRKVFSDVIDADTAFKVLATASDGKEAVALALKLKPDIITMDLEMPNMNGLEALKRIMTVQPTPVIMLSAVTDNGTRDTIKALQYGAIDFIRKPDGAVKLDISQVREQLLEKLHIALETVSSGTLRMLPAVEEKNISPPLPEPKLAESAPPSPATVQKVISPSDAPSRKADIGTNKAPATPTIPKSQELFRQQSSFPENRNPIVKPSPASSSGKLAKAKLPEVQSSVKAVRHSEALAATTNTDKVTAVKRITKAAVNPDKPIQKAPVNVPVNHTSTHFVHLVAIGTSTGGPRALHEVLTGIPADFPAPILVVQHMPPKFTHSLAQRLDNFCSINVREAVDGELVETATAYIAPGGRHMTLGKDAKGLYRIKLSDEGPRGGHRPSVDVLFESLLGHQQLKRHVVLMTGMGSDGAKGMKLLQSDGVLTTIAEAEQTCVVYGMPRSAVELGAVSHLLPLQDIASILIQEVKSRKP
jgi:two-component system chemotaxis response regulator CheB